ncbi:MAG: T9SS type A sorting domain-containing protein [Cytophagaceae bacterium]
MTKFLQTVLAIVFLSMAMNSAAEVKVFAPNKDLQGPNFFNYYQSIADNPSYPTGEYHYINYSSPLVINGVTFYNRKAFTKLSFVTSGITSPNCPSTKFVPGMYTEVITSDVNNYPLLFTNTALSIGSFFGKENVSLSKNVGKIFFNFHDDVCNGSRFMYSTQQYLDYYIGFVVTIEGNDYYGWMKFNSSSGSEILKEWAYESMPNLPIAVGMGSSLLGLQTKSIIVGKAFLDLNNNCKYDNYTDKILSNIKVRLNDSLIVTTDNNGDYNMIVSGTPQTYSLRVEDPQGQFNPSSSCTVSTVHILNSGQTSIVNLPMIQSSCGSVEVSINPIQLRRCFVNDITVNVFNRDPNAGASTQVRVIIPPLTTAISSVPSWNSKNGDTLLFTIATPAFLSNTRITILDSVHCYNENYLGVGQCIKAEIIKTSTCMNGINYTGSDIISYGTCYNDYYELYIKERGQSSASDSTYYEIFLDDTLVKQQKILLAPNDSMKVIVPTKGKSMYVKIQQDHLHPLWHERTWVGEGCGDWSSQTISKGYVDQYFYTQKDVLTATQCVTIRGSYDPNDKQAFPSRTDHLIRPNQDITYKIRFQNTGTDKAIHVCVVDTIAPYLDINSIKNITVSHPLVFKNIVNIQNRIVYFQFTDINLPYKSADSAGSNGYIQFTISQLPDVTLGTEINNTAAIYFDYNSPVITNTTSQILGVPVIADQQLKWLNWNGNTTVCENDKLVLKTITNGVVSSTWYDPQGNIVSQTDSLVIPTMSTTQAGLYKLKLKGIMDSLEVNSAMIQVNSTPDLVPTNLQSCLGATIDLADQVEDTKNLSGDYAFYLSSVSGTPLTSSTTNEPGTYFVIKNSNGCKDTTSIQFVTQMCTNTNGAKNAVNLKIYPNPTQDYLAIETEQNFFYVILKSDGSIMERGTLMTGKQEINVKNWVKGFYVFQVIDKGTTVYQESIVVQ